VPCGTGRPGTAGAPSWCHGFCQRENNQNNIISRHRTTSAKTRATATLRQRHIPPNVSTHYYAKMKIKASNTLFWIVILLILLLPVGKNYGLFLFGGRTEGIATHIHNYYSSFSSWGGGPISYSVFDFKVNGYTYSIEGVSNLKFDDGKKCKIIYKKKNPWRCIIPSFSYLYLSSNAVFSATLLIVWIAFYTSFYGLKKQNKLEISDKIDKTNNVC